MNLSKSYIYQNFAKQINLQLIDYYLYNFDNVFVIKLKKLSF